MLVVILSCAMLQGCIALLAAGAVGGAVYTTSDDSSEVTFERPWGNVFEACVGELGDRGVVGFKDRDTGLILGHLEGVKIEIRLVRATEHSVKMTVQARKHEGISPAPDVAEKVAFGVIRRLG